MFIGFYEFCRTHSRSEKDRPSQLIGQRRYRDLFLFVVGINTASRISDFLTLRVMHFLDEKQQIKRRFWIKERKRGKRHEVFVNSSVREICVILFAICIRLSDVHPLIQLYSSDSN
jgi:hypothetical protein